MSEDNKTDLTPEMLEVMRARAAYWKPPDREWCIGEDHMARDVLDLVGEVERLRDALTDKLIGAADLRDEVDELRSESEQSAQAIERWRPLADSIPAAIRELVGEVQRLSAEMERIRENADCVISGSLADHLGTAEVRDAIRDAFDAGARAMWDAILADNMVAAFIDITKLPGRPGTKGAEEDDA